MLIGLNGRLQAGKDTTFNLIQEYRREAERVSFADLLKNSAADSIGMSLDLLEWLKNNEDYKFVIHSTEASSRPAFIQDELSKWTMNVRQYLQWYGTEGHRNWFGDEFWVDAALPTTFDHQNRMVIVTDMRFPNEVQRIIDLGGITVKIEREKAPSVGHNHASEQNIDHLIDYTIDNTGDLANLRKNVEVFLADLVSLQRKASGRRIHSHSESLLQTRG